MSKREYEENLQYNQWQADGVNIVICLYHNMRTWRHSIQFKGRNLKYYLYLFTYSAVRLLLSRVYQAKFNEIQRVIEYLYDDQVRVLQISDK